MTTKELYKIEILKELSLLPEESLKNVKLYIEFILNKEHNRKASPINLKGIWKGSGFEKISDLHNEVSKLRKNLSAGILKKGNL
ncbi:MAG: hypothetical protein R6V47_00955 [Candidatus Delongbacteria bacterium]